MKDLFMATFSYLFSTGPQPMELCHPHRNVSYFILSGNVFTARGVFLW